MVPRLLKTVLGLPLKIVRRALKQWTFSKPEIIPVGGLTPEVSSELLFALRQAATTAEVPLFSVGDRLHCVLDPDLNNVTTL